MSEADKMFEELGYKLIEGSIYDFKYYKDFNNVIYFYKNSKEIHKYGEYEGLCDGITMEELKAINKKVEELGWEV